MNSPENSGTGLRSVASAFWQWLRGFSGDTAYESYLRRAGERSGPQLTAEEFYLDDMQRKYTRPNRCC
jgi:hypothetical protein